MSVERHHGGGIIVATFIVAFMLTAMPLPDWAVNWRPAWVAMVLIYWCIALPDRAGIGIAWMLGLLLDVQQGTLLGQNALGLTIVAFIALNSHQRMRMFPLPQQAILIGGYVLLLQFLTLWIRGIMGVPPEHWTFWTPAFTSMLLWPWVFIVMRDLRRTYHVF
jgi:rod shape-determining protein MreD